MTEQLLHILLKIIKNSIDKVREKEYIMKCRC